MVPAKTRLDFVVLNHDEDLIGVALREQLAATQRRQQSTVKNAVIETVVVTDARADLQLLGKPDMRVVLSTQDLEAVPLPK